MQESKDSKPFLVFLKNRHFKAVSGLQENCKDIVQWAPIYLLTFPYYFSNFTFIVDTITDVPISLPFAHLHPVPTRPVPAITTLFSVSVGYAYMFLG